MLGRTKLIARLCILAVLLAGSWFVLLSPQTQVVHAYRCCETCPGSNPSDEEYCYYQCGSYSGTCYQNCAASQQQCWRNCRSCGGSDGSGACDTNSDCPYLQGYGFGYCIGGNCVY